MDEKLRERLFRRQGFTSISLEVWHPGNYLKLCRKNNTDRFPISTIPQALKLTQANTNSSDLIVAVSTCLLDDDALENYLIKLGVNKSSRIEEVASQLRILVINELYANSDVYEGYLYGDHYGDEIASFANGKKVSDDLSRTLPQAISNTLGVIIILIPSCFGFPFLPIVPQSGLATEAVVFLWCEPLEKGFASVLNVTKGLNITSCRCGRRDKIQKARCLSDERCSCLKRGVLCNQACLCKGCTNGKPIKSEHSVKRRKRIQPKLSEVTPLTSYNAAMHSGVDIPETLNQQQHVFLEAILYMELRDMKIALCDLDVNDIAENLSCHYKQLSVEISSDADECTGDLKPLNATLVRKWLEQRINCATLESR